jgi:Chaperone for flagella basal body P-ring formation
MKPYALLVVLAIAAPSLAGEPVVVVLPAKAAAVSTVVALGQVAKIHGGDEKVRATLAAVDLVERTKKDAPITITRRQVEIRLKLAGYTQEDVLVGGADSIIVSVKKEVVSTEDAIAAAKKSALALFANADELKVELIQPVAVKMPEIALGDSVSISAVPHAAVTKVGRVQMDVAIKVNGEMKLAFPVHFNIRPIRPEPVLVKALQPVSMVVRLGAMNVEATGEAIQDGRAGETIKVRNSASKKIVSGRVTAAGVVEIDIGGAP